MDPTIVRRNDLFDRRAQLKAADRIFVWVIVGYLLAVPAILIWNGGLIGLWISLALVFFVAIWTWLEGVWERWRMRRRLRKATVPSYAGDRKDPQIAAWLLLTNTVGLGIDAQNQSLHLFTLKKPVESFPRADLRRIEARRKRTWLGRWRSTLFISEDFGGPGRDLPVIDGDLPAFLRLAVPDTRRQGFGALKPAASA